MTAERDPASVKRDGGDGMPAMGSSLMRAAAIGVSALTLSAASVGKRLLIFTSGSRGDVQPFVALSTSLQAAGFVVRILTNINHVEFMRGFGLDAVGASHDAEKWIKEDPAMLKCMADGNFMDFSKGLAEHGKKVFPAALQVQLREARDFSPDLVLTSALEATQAWAIAGVMGIPTVLCGLTAWSPSGDDTSPIEEPMWLPRWCHRLAWHVVCMFWIKSEKEGKHATLLEQLPGCEPYLIQNTPQQILTTEKRTEPTLIGVSPVVAERQEDWPDSMTLTGFWVVDKDEQEHRMLKGDAMFGGGSACEEVSCFLQRGARPVYVGWGSMVSVSTGHMACLAVRALRRAGLRGVVLGGWAELSTDSLRGQPDSQDLLAYAAEHVLFVKTAPHEWLFPQCAAIVHHGGSGTTAAALRSGTPSIITPCGFDQFSNARMVARSGAGLALPQVSRVEPEALANAMLRATTDAQLAGRAEEVGRRLRAEDGTRVAVEVLDRFIAQDVVTGAWHRSHAKVMTSARNLERPGLLAALGIMCRVLCNRKVDVA